MTLGISDEGVSGENIKSQGGDFCARRRIFNAPRSRVTWRLLGVILFLSLAFVQIIMGGDIVCVFLIICSVIIGLVPVASKYTSSSYRCIIYMVGHILFLERAW